MFHVCCTCGVYMLSRGQVWVPCHDTRLFDLCVVLGMILYCWITRTVVCVKCPDGTGFSSERADSMFYERHVLGLFHLWRVCSVEVKFECLAMRFHFEALSSHRVFLSCPPAPINIVRIYREVALAHVEHLCRKRVWFAFGLTVLGSVRMRVLPCTCKVPLKYI